MSGKTKLNIEEQIEDMKSKGITFELCSEDDARKFLKNNTYYFKLKSYERNYDKYQSSTNKGKYINLDFAYLKELSTLDMYLRKAIILMALDAEHALKVQLINDISCDPDEDGYHIVEEFFNDDYLKKKGLHDKIGKSAGSDLVQKRMMSNDKYAVWEIVEVLSFGEFIDLYQRYYSGRKNPSDYSSFLWSVKFIRNAAAHNNCLLNSLKAPYNVALHKNKEILNEISKIKTVSAKQRETWMKNPAVHDFIILVFVYVKVVKSSGIKKHGIQNLMDLFKNRMKEHSDYFTKNNSLTGCYAFVSSVIEYLCNKYRK